MSECVPRKTTETLLQEIDARLRLLEAERPIRFDGMVVSSTSKLPANTLRYREALLWRIVQLGRTAFENFERNKLASAILLTRAAIETSAALWCLWIKLRAAVESKALGHINDYLVNLVMGHRTDLDVQPQAISVLTFVNDAEKGIEGFREQYDRLSEFAHPGWAGTTLLFSKLDDSKTIVEFGENERASDTIKAVGVSNLSVALAMFETGYNLVTDLMPAFVWLCERQPGPSAPSPSDEA